MTGGDVFMKNIWHDIDNDRIKATDFIVCIESICVALGAYPLNIEGNPAYKSEWKATLMSLRHNCK